MGILWEIMGILRVYYGSQNYAKKTYVFPVLHYGPRYGFQKVIMVTPKKT